MSFGILLTFMKGKPQRLSKSYVETVSKDLRYLGLCDGFSAGV